VGTAFERPFVDAAVVELDEEVGVLVCDPVGSIVEPWNGVVPELVPRTLLLLAFEADGWDDAEVGFGKETGEDGGAFEPFCVGDEMELVD